MKILSVKGENLLSLGKFEVTFGDSGLVLVEGWNYDDNRANGAGKTAIFNLISLGLYQKLPRKINISETLKHGEKNGYVEVNVLAGDKKYTAFYGRPKKRLFRKDDQEVDMTQEEFESTIGLTYDQFLTSMYTAQGGGNKFLDKNDTDKKKFLLDLMNLNDFTECKRAADQKIKELNKLIGELNLKNEKAKSKIEAYSEQDLDEVGLMSEVEKLQSEIVDLKRKVNQVDSVEKPDLSKFIDLENKIQQKKNHFSQLRGQRATLSAQYQKDKANASLPFKESEPDAACPSCSSNLSIRGKTVVLHEDQSALKKQHEDHCNTLMDLVKELKVKIDEIDKELYEEKNIKTLEDQLKDKKAKQLSDYNEAQQRRYDLMSLIKTKDMKIANLKKQIANVQDTKQKVQTLKEFVKKSNHKILSLQKECTVYEEVSNMFSPTGAPAYVMDSIVDTFNESVNEHITLIWPSASYELRSHKEKATGDVVAKFSDTLIINGNQQSIGAMSGGEARAFSLAIDFAIIDILNKQFGLPLSPIVMDEPFEGLDAAGREVVIELLEKLAVNRQIWVVDHASESKAMFSDILRVEKRNGTSKIVSS